MAAGRQLARLAARPSRSEFNAATQPGADGTLASFEQRLWRVAFASYQLAPAKADAGSPLLVPRRIDLEHGELRLRLTIDDWHAVVP